MWIIIIHYIITNILSNEDNITFIHLHNLSGPTAACAEQGLTDLSSQGTMHENGWDLAEIQANYRLVLPRDACNFNLLDAISKHSWFIQGWLPSMISATFWAKGKVQLMFGNCNEVGEVVVLVDGNEVEKSKPNGRKTNATFYVDEDSKLVIKADSRAIIKLFEINIECGKKF